MDTISYLRRELILTKNNSSSKISKYGWKAAIIAAVTPIPDDIVYISLGLARYSPWKFAISTFIGKLAINEIVIWAAIYWSKPFIDKFTKSNIRLIHSMWWYQ